MLDRLRSNPYANVAWLLLACAAHMVLFGARVDADLHLWQRLLSMIAAICVTLPLHELIHFILMKGFSGGRRVRIRLARSPIGLPTLVTVAEADFRPWQMILVYLAPFVLMTLLPDLVFAFAGSIPPVAFIAVVCNAAGCFYDLLDALIIARKPRP